jgi:hypothetical protein
VAEAGPLNSCPVRDRKLTVGKPDRVAKAPHELRPNLPPRAEHHCLHRGGRYQLIKAKQADATIKYPLYSCSRMVTRKHVRALPAGHFAAQDGRG